MAITETWLRGGDENAVNELCGNEYKFIGEHRPEKKGKRGGGIGFVLKSKLNVKTQPHDFSTFEAMTLTIRAELCSSITLIYRPPPSQKNGFTVNEFLKEMEVLMSDLCSNSVDNLIVIGDLNMHYGKSSDPCYVEFDQMINCLGMQQLVKDPTHKSGNTLDVIIAREENHVHSIYVHQPDFSDHSLLTFSINVKPIIETRAPIKLRSLRKVNMTAFVEDVRLRMRRSEEDGDEAVDRYVKVSRETLDKHAPLRSVQPKGNTCKNWYDDAIHEERRKRRRTERQYRKTGLEVHRQMMREQDRKVVEMIKEKKAQYFNGKFREADCKETFKLFNSLITNDRNKPLPVGRSDQNLANGFAAFFRKKIEKIQSDLEILNASDLSKFPHISHGSCESRLFSFTQMTIAEIELIIRKCEPKSCSLDPVPTSMLRNRQLLQLLLPLITDLINTSLNTGVVPESLKESLVAPRLKKAGLDPNEMKHYRPVSNIPFIAKVLEKVVVRQLTNYLQENGLWDEYQSAYRSNHSVETALLKVKTDIECMMDAGDAAVLVLLDQSAAFDTIDHQVLLNRLEKEFGISGIAVEWIRNYLQNRKQYVKVNESLSEAHELQVGVPQGSVMGPILFLLYVAPIGRIIEHYGGICRHSYADDTQLYCRLPMKNENEIKEEMEKMNSCVNHVRTWMIKNKLKINDDKTEVIFIASKNNKKKITEMDIKITIGGVDIKESSSVKNLGVIFDQELAMDKQVSSITKSIYHQLRRIKSIKQHLTEDSQKKIVHACITSRLDFNNALLIGCSEKVKRKLQLLQNNVARFLTGTGRRDHITPVLFQLHWLRINARIFYKVLSILHKAIHDPRCPAYMKSFIAFNRPPRTLRSTDDAFKLLPPVPKLTVLEKSLMVEGFKKWNNLPLALRNMPNTSHFKKCLKTYLFTIS